MRMASYTSRCGFVTLGAAVLAGTSVTALPAQEDSRCAAWASALTTGTPTGLALEAEHAIRLCPVSGPVALGAAWGRIPANKLRLDYLWTSSRAIRDQRLLDSLTAVAQRASRPELVRSWAILSLLAFAAPNADAMDPRSFQVFARGEGFNSGGHLPDLGYGSVPPSTNAAQSIANLLNNFNYQSASDSLKVTAIGALLYITAERPELVVPTPNSFYVTYVCGTRFRIVHRARTLLRVRLEIVGTADVREIPYGPLLPPVESETRHIDMTLFGPLRASVAGHEIMTATPNPSTAPTPCP